MRSSSKMCLLLVLLSFGASLTATAENLGPDDRQVSFTGPAGTVESDAVTPALAYDNLNQRYLSVWSADENDGDFQIYGQMLSGASGASIGSPFLIGATGLPGSDNRQPAVAFNDVDQVYLVVWSSDATVPGAYEILGQAVSVDGQLVGSTNRYSDMGTPDLDVQFDAVTPDLVWHPGLGSFVVVWAGDDDTGDLVDGHFELYGQLVNGTNRAETGANDFRISISGPGIAGNDATNPAIAITDDPQRWFVAFEGDINDDGIHDPEVWIYGGTGDVPDGDAFLVSLMGSGVSDDGLSARNPDLVWNAVSSELVCIWDGDHGGGSPRTVYAQRALPDGTIVGVAIDLSTPVSAMTPLRESIEPAVAVNPVTGDWFVTWRGDLDDSFSHFNHEIWATRCDANGVLLVNEPFVISDMSPGHVRGAGAGAPAVGLNAHHDYKLIIWSGDLDSTPGGELEIFAQGWADNALSAANDTPGVVASQLHGAVPNPFNPVTKIEFAMAQAEHVKLSVYDIAGREVVTLVDEDRGAGLHAVQWDGRDAAGRKQASGVYLYRFETPSFAQTRRMMLVK